MRDHLKYMLIGAAGIFVVTLALGLPPQRALVLSVALACPLMMMFGGHGAHGGHTRHAHTPSGADAADSLR